MAKSIGAFLVRYHARAPRGDVGGCSAQEKLKMRHANMWFYMANSSIVQCTKPTLSARP